MVAEIAKMSLDTHGLAQLNCQALPPLLVYFSLIKLFTTGAAKIGAQLPEIVLLRYRHDQFFLSPMQW